MYFCVNIWHLQGETYQEFITREKELFLLNIYARTDLFFSFQTMVWRWGGIKNTGTSELHILMCSDGLREKERSVGRSRSGHHGVTHLVQCPYMRTVTAQSSETPVKAEAGRAACRKNLFSSCLAPPPPSFCLHPSFYLLFFWERNRTKATIEAV